MTTRADAQAPNSIYLCAPINALVEGIYEENIPLSTIREHGDFGLGTFNDLDGEMVLLDGIFYQVHADGRITIADDETLTPFACSTHFRPSTTAEIRTDMDYEAFLKFLVGLLPSPNLFYAIRVDGEFRHVKTRSVPKQQCYRPLVEVAREQATFDYDDAVGSIAGFYTPSFMAALSVPGLHLHFLSTDHTEGGHVLECRPRQAHVAVQFIHRLELSLPTSREYLGWDFSRDIRADLDEAER